jgi:dephospho-CoA kinase
MSKIIIGMAGQIGSGKDFIAEYIRQKYGGAVISFSDPLRDILKRLFLPIDRKHLSYLSQSLVEKFGTDILSKTIATEIERSNKKIFVLPNIRRPGDYKYLKDQPGFVLVGVEADPKICYERVVKRGQNEDDKTKTWEEFQIDLKRPTEVEIAALIKSAKFHLNNNGTVQELHKQIDDLMKEIAI